MNIKEILLIIIFATVVTVFISIFSSKNKEEIISKAKSEYNDRCMKYFGNQGYPANYYCKLFIGEIKARYIVTGKQNISYT